jgi:hypothetical protein
MEHKDRIVDFTVRIPVRRPQCRVMDAQAIKRPAFPEAVIWKPSIRLLGRLVHFLDKRRWELRLITLRRFRFSPGHFDDACNGCPKQREMSPRNGHECTSFEFHFGRPSPWTNSVSANV